MSKPVALLTLLSCAVGVSALPTLSVGGEAGAVIRADGRPRVLWGVDADTWASDRGDLEALRAHCEASVAINATSLSIPVTWKNVERTGPGQYDWRFVDGALALCREYGLAAVLMWIGIDYAAGDPNFVPPYIDAEPGTYTRITGFGYDEQRQYRLAAGAVDDGRIEDRLHCPSCPATLAREAAAYAALMDHVAQVDQDETVVAVNICGEIDYVRALDPALWVPERDVRCRCRHCHAAYVPGTESSIAFMTGQFARYVKTIIEAGAVHLDLPTYSQVCSHRWFPGWRYAEDPVALKAIINRQNHFVVPSIAPTVSAAAYTSEELDYFRPECIPGNVIFVDGIDTGWPDNLAHIELAPWYALLRYGGLGAVYWDSPSVSIVKADEPRRERFRRAFGPLKAVEWALARHKAAGPGKLGWWGYDQPLGEVALDGFRVTYQNDGGEYGLALALSSERLVVATTSLAGATRITLQRPAGWAGWRFERGHLGAASGDWLSSGLVEAKVDGQTAEVTMDGDSGDWRQAALLASAPQ